MKSVLLAFVLASFAALCVAEDKPITALIVGGGSSHDFNKWFNQADSATLGGENRASVNYTDQPSAIAPALKDIDVLYQSSNQKMEDPMLRKAILEFAEVNHVDHIVIGARQNSMLRTLLGSVSAKVALT
jgi:hypothetical protein